MTEVVDDNRRDFLRLGLVAMACSVARPALAAMPRMKGAKRLSFHNLHTDERLNVEYWKDGDYDRKGLDRINNILRDFRTGDVYPVRPALIDLLHDLQTKLKNHNTIEIISGYRSPKSNAMLSKASDGVAHKSLHMKGMAIDLRVNGSSLRQIQNAALLIRRGGVGYYPKSGFVHVDVGRVRRW
jgi:uncharacterized protein YcbK (DUF882 family)